VPRRPTNVSACHRVPGDTIFSYPDKITNFGWGSPPRSVTHLGGSRAGAHAGPAAGPSARSRTLARSMATPDEIPLQPGPARQWPADGQPGAAQGVPAAFIAIAGIIAGTAVLGVVAGFVWAAIAPRALVEVVGSGSADIVNPETNAFFAADAWFMLLSVAGGLVSGAAGYALAVRRNGPPAMAGILAGGLAAALLAKWIGQQSGAAAFNHSLALGHVGLLLRDPPMAGGLGALMFWPLAAGLVAGSMELFSQRPWRRQ